LSDGSDKSGGPWSRFEEDEIESALEGAFSEAIPDEETRHDPFAGADEFEDEAPLPPLELPSPSPSPSPEPSPTPVAARPSAPPLHAPLAEPIDGTLEAAWRRAAADLDDAGAQQRFVQACLAAGQLRFAVRCYRGLAEGPEADPRAARQLKKVGALLGFHAPPVQVADDAMSPRLKLMLVGIVFAAVAVAGAAWWLG